MYTRINHYIAIVVYLIASIIILRQPLLGDFGYEYAALFALIASLIAGWNAIRDERRSGTLSPQVRYRNGLVINIAYLLIPVIVGFLASLPGFPCDPLDGLTFFALLPVVSVIFSYSLGWLVSLLFRWARITFLCIMVFWLMVSVLTTILQPKIFFYNPFIGFFPGLSYDQLIPVTSTLILYRAYTVFLAGLIVLILYMLRFTPLRDASLRDRVRLFRHTYANSFVSIFITIGLILVFVQLLSRGALGFSTTRGQLENTLGNEFNTRAFSIYYSSENFDDRDILWVALEHEFQRHRTMDKLGVLHIGRIRSYLYPDRETKRSLLGPAVTNIAKPWSKEVHLNADNYQRSLQHELAHVIAGNFGMPVLRISNSAALMEGVAMAVEGVSGNRTLHEHAAAIVQFELVRDPGALVENRRFTQHYSAVSYVMMGSFVQYLIDRYGIHRVRSAYAWSEYESAFDRPREQLVREWINFLQRINVSERQRIKTMIHFKRPSLFQVRCPRSLARYNRTGMEYLQKEDYAGAETFFRRSWDMVRNGTALEGLLRAWYDLGEHDRVLEYLEDEQLQAEFPQIIPVLYRISGDIYAMRGEYGSAERMYRRLLTLDHSDTINELMWIRLLALENPGDTDLWRILYFEREDQESIIQSITETTTDTDISTGLHWILARHAHLNGDYERSGTFHRTLRNRIEESYLHYLVTLRVGESLLYSGKFQDAIVEFWDAMNLTESPVDLHRLNEWIDRAQFAEEYGTLIWENNPPWN
jgi:tetratricopeptide (TPR) repeat protein